MTSRAEQKARTRDALIDSWLRIIGSGTNFAAVSLREVAKTAGVVPTSFYRHFDDMDELGLAAVDELGLDLRRLVRGGVAPGTSAEDLVADVVRVYVAYVDDHADLVQFVNQARTGGSPSLREAIEHELDFFSSRVAAALADVLPDLRPEQCDTVAAVVLAVLLESTAEVLALPTRNEARRRVVVERLQSRLAVVLDGARAVAAPAPPALVPPTAASRRPRKATAS